MTTNSLNNSSTAFTINNAYTFPTIDGSANQVLKTNGGGTVTWGSTAGTGEVVQYVENSISSLVICLTTIPIDDTIPQQTEGTEVLTVSITPTSATNILLIKFIGTGDNRSTVPQALALFQDTTANALAACYLDSLVDTSSLSYKMIAGTTSSTTFKIRVGGGGVATTEYLLNGWIDSGSDTRVFGGVSATTLEVWELIP